MSREQRQKAVRSSEIRAALAKFADSPCRLSTHQTRALLYDLCVELGYCLSSRDNEAVEADPPTDPKTFAELIMKLEGVGSGDPEMFTPVLEIVLAAFEAAQAEVPSSSPLD